MKVGHPPPHPAVGDHYFAGSGTVYVFGSGFRWYTGFASFFSFSNSFGSVA